MFTFLLKLGKRVIASHEFLFENSLTCFPIHVDVKQKKNVA